MKSFAHPHPVTRPAIYGQPFGFPKILCPRVLATAEYREQAFALN